MYNNHVHGQLCPTLCNPMDCTLSGFSVHEVSRQEYCNGGHFLLQSIFLTQGSNPGFLHFLHWQANSFDTAPPGKPKIYKYRILCQ